MVGQRRNRAIWGVVTAIVLALAPLGSAGPTDHLVDAPGAPPTEFLDAVVNLTVAYVEDFDLNDNATTMQEKTTDYLTNLAQIVHNLLGGIVCTDFELGIDWSWVGVLPQANFQKMTIEYSLVIYGHDEEQNRDGIGMMHIEISAWGSCQNLIEVKPLVQSSNDNQTVEELPSGTDQQLASSPGFWCC